MSCNYIDTVSKRFIPSTGPPSIDITISKLSSMMDAMKKSVSKVFFDAVSGPADNGVLTRAGPVLRLEHSGPGGAVLRPPF